jgi:hypothetical protein
MKRRGADRSLLTLVIVGAAGLLGVVAAVDAFRPSDGEVAGPTTTAPDDGENLPATSATVRRVDISRVRRHSRTVGGVPFSFTVGTAGWEEFGRISINKSIVGPQGAEAIIFWSSFPDGDDADLCTEVLNLPEDRSAGNLATAVANAPGTELVTGPSNVTLGGRAAKHVVLTVRKRVGCEPGFFYRWEDAEVGALWTQTNVGDTIRVWIVDVGGTRLFIEAETSTQADPQLEREVVEIVESIRFD